MGRLFIAERAKTMHLSRVGTDKYQLWDKAFNGKIVAEFDVRFFNKLFPDVKVKPQRVIRVGIKPERNGFSLKKLMD